MDDYTIDVAGSIVAELDGISRRRTDPTSVMDVAVSFLAGSAVAANTDHAITIANDADPDPVTGQIALTNSGET